MSYPRLQAAAVTALAVLPSIACTIDVGGIVQEEEPGSGGGDGNGGGSGPSGSESAEGKLSSNGLFLAPSAMLALGTGPLTSTSEGVADLLDREDGARHLEYTALCALDAGTSLTVGEATYPGLYGLAPEWADAPCDESCQRWVTACLLAHTNVGGYSVEISMRGAHPGMAWSPEIEQTFVIEGSFYDHDGICRAGEFVWRRVGSFHETHSDEGAVILATVLARTYGGHLLVIGERGVLLDDAHHHDSAGGAERHFHDGGEGRR